MRCPVCRADNASGPSCRRCKADLTLLFNLEAQRDQALAAATYCVRQGQLTRALRLAEGADALRGDDRSRELLAVIHLLRRDFALAWRYGRQLGAAGSRD
jgi:hypothetical protein